MNINEEAKSKAQQRLFGMALSHKRGNLELDDLPNEEVKDKVKELSELPEDTLEEYASTKHDHLPDTVEESLREWILENATLTNTIGMGNVTLPTDGNVGSGDIPRTSKADKEKNATSKMLSYEEFIELHKR